MCEDPSAFAREIVALHAELRAAVGEEDRAHFRKLEGWGRAASALGWATSWIAPNPLSVACIALGTSTRWTIVAHHVLHRGLDRAGGPPPSTTFARGWKRKLEWLDWLDRDAWDHEHNVAHHGHVGEVMDPDQVEINMQMIRDASWPRTVKWAVIGFYACTWRLTYYAPNAWRSRRTSRPGVAADADAPIVAELDPRTRSGRAFLRSLLPYAGARFVLAPLLAAPLGPLAAMSVLTNSVLAEVLTNIHTFALIAPNHAGDDLARFDAPVSGRGAGGARAERLVRQVLGSANYTGGSDLADFLQGFLNYQIEHHLFPDLPPRMLQVAQPRVRAICGAHGVPYVMEPLATRLKKLFPIMTGEASMRRHGSDDERAESPSLAG